MKFFESPKMVTAVVFFLETILALFKVEYFLILPFEQILISLILLTLLPFGFHAVYSYILRELGDKEAPAHQAGDVPKFEEAKEAEDVDVVAPQEDVAPTLHEPQADKAIEEALEPEMEPEPVGETETVDEDTEPVQEKKIQIVTVDDVYQEDEAVADPLQEDTIQPVTTKRANRSRMERKRKARGEQ